MNKVDIDINFVKKLAKKAGRLVMKEMNHITKIKKNDIRDVSTNVDEKIENLIVAQIQKRFPNHNIHREEMTDIEKKSDYTWVIDPIDGTKYFVKGVKFFTVSIGLFYKDEPVVGVVYNPGTKDCYWASKGQGAFLNKERLQLSKVDNLSEAIISTDVGSMQMYNPEQKKLFSQQIQNIIDNFYRIRIFGNGSLSLCYLAQGYFDAYFDTSIREHFHDLGAGLIIASEAGAKITNLDNVFPGLKSSHLLVTNGLIHDKAINLLKDK